MPNQSPKEKLQMYLDARRPIIYIRNSVYEKGKAVLKSVGQKVFSWL